MRRSRAPTDHFGELRAQLRWQIDHYKIAVETLRDRKQPETFEIVDRALRSLTELSKRFRRGASSTELDEFVAEELEEFEIEGDEPDEPPLVDDQIWSRSRRGTRAA